MQGWDPHVGLGTAMPSNGLALDVFLFPACLPCSSVSSPRGDPLPWSLFPQNCFAIRKQCWLWRADSPGEGWGSSGWECWLRVHSSDSAVLQLRLAGKPGGIQGRGVKFNQRSARSLVLSRRCQHVFVSPCLGAGALGIDCCSAVIGREAMGFLLDLGS